MIKIANNLEKLAYTKSSFFITPISALLHGAAADDDEPVFREILRGAVKGLGGDIGMLGGAAFGGGLGQTLGSAVNLENPTSLGGLGALGGGTGGGIGGYLLMNKLVNSIGKKKQKEKNQ